MDPAEEARRIRSRMERLASVALRIHSEHTLERVFQEVVDAARDVTGARYAALGVLDENRDKLSAFVTSGLTPEQHARIGDLPRGHGILGLLIKNPEPIRLPDLAKHPKSYGFPPHHPPMKSFLGVPIIGRQGPMGNLYLTEKMDAPEFTTEDETIAMMLAAQAAVAVDNARLHEESARLLAEVRNMQISRDRFFAMISHELRNALTAVYGWSDLLVRKGNAPRAALEVHESAERTLTLVNDLLDLSRLEADRLKPVIRTVEARELVREATGSLEPSAQSRHVRLAVQAPPAEVTCQTDPQRVRQILINLLSNAVRHSPENDIVEVLLAVDGSRLRFDVVDHGEGIAQGQQAGIFEAFVQADSTRERGTGLGLTLSRQLARLLGGDLRVESQPGKGARFILDLPRYY
ncbi:MAG: GAF domain-containing sensor histidine kinase [Gemmatimonadetes bacterium]|nr:GAF domain-containing sensor histidine kinase [Gemmatimonadota bacterium]